MSTSGDGSAVFKHFVSRAIIFGGQLKIRKKILTLDRFKGNEVKSQYNGVGVFFKEEIDDYPAK